MKKYKPRKYRQSSGYKKKPGKSMTLPDQNLSIAELLDRHSRGVSLGAPDLKGEYFDTEIPRYDDLTDMLEHKKTLIQQQKDLTKEINKQLASKKENKKETSIKEKPVDEVTEAEEKAEAKKH